MVGLGQPRHSRFTRTNMTQDFLNRTNWITFAALVLGALLILKGHSSEGSGFVVGGFALLNPSGHGAQQ